MQRSGSVTLNGGNNAHKWLTSLRGEPRTFEGQHHRQLGGFERTIGYSNRNIFKRCYGAESVPTLQRGVRTPVSLLLARKNAVWIPASILRDDGPVVTWSIPAVDLHL
jgi:hypothetical protein